jgi:hypothetical protein
VIILIFLLIKVAALFVGDSSVSVENVPLIKAEVVEIKKMPSNSLMQKRVEKEQMNVYDIVENKKDNEVIPVFKVETETKPPETMDIDGDEFNVFAEDQRMLTEKINELSEIGALERVEVPKKQQKPEPEKNVVSSMKVNESNAKKNKTNVNDLEKLGNGALIKNIKQHKDVKPSDIKIQLLAMKSREALVEYWKDLAKRYKSLFDNKNYYVEKVEINNVGTMYRLQVGNFGDENEALTFCKEYVRVANKGKLDCIVVKE